jgi:2-polyprenyl-3-methyl-5-hydroxy-6-metoxy-1,4-benzoquinol methylase
LAGGYFEYSREEVAALAPAGVRRVLDVGCATGKLGALLKAREGCEVHGVEINSAAAEQARLALDSVMVGDAEKLDLPFPDGFFDCLIYADVLEHLRNPQEMLLRHTRHLAPGGWVVVSVPNVRSWETLSPLIFRGAWRYQEAGVLDRTHLRFFTRRSAQEMVEGAGYRVVRTVYNVPRSRGYRRTNRLTCGLLREFLAVQILMLGQKAAETAADGRG